ncbi:MAG: glycosyltransferase family 39 protein [Rudaea sp.]
MRAGALRSLAWPRVVVTDLEILVLLAIGRVLLHTLLNGQYGFHRDELGMLDNARYLDWGYVEYPPLTAWLVRLELALFGASLPGLRLLPAIAQAGVMVLAGRMAFELGGRRFAQVLAALAAGLVPFSLAFGGLFQYSSFDYLWFVLIAYLLIRLLKTDDTRWWLGIGAVIGVGMLTKYTMAFYVAGIVLGVLLTPVRRHLASGWLWGGVALALLVVTPNLLWQANHNFVSFDFLTYIHARDVRIGRADTFVIEQLLLCANAVTIPLWLAGLYFYAFAPRGARYRTLFWMFAVPVVLLYALSSRGYYTAAAYPMLLSAGAVLLEQGLMRLSNGWKRLAATATWGGLTIGSLLCVIVLPVAPLPSALFDFVGNIHDVFREEVGWPELVTSVAGVYAALPDSEKPQAGILAHHVAEAGAINLYGPAYGLPEAISGGNTAGLRGYGDPPRTIIVVGWPSRVVNYYFGKCDWAARITNPYGVINEVSRDNPDIWLCRDIRSSWSTLWQNYPSKYQ